MRLDRITTRAGDDGTTGLADGSRLPKHHALIAAIGAVDEANSLFGVVRTCPLPADLAEELPRVQNDLFDLGADVANPRPGGCRITPAHIARLEAAVAASTARVPPLTSFVLPGGSPGAAWLHLARTVVRRAERDLAAAMSERHLNADCLRYLNRLSDACFVWARRANDDGRADVLWQPGKHAAADAR
jgi:cob(I)alamin adenosyltransferase